MDYLFEFLQSLLTRSSSGADVFPCGFFFLGWLFRGAGGVVAKIFSYYRILLFRDRWGLCLRSLCHSPYLVLTTHPERLGEKGIYGGDEKGTCSYFLLILWGMPLDLDGYGFKWLVRT